MSTKTSSTNSLKNTKQRTLIKDAFQNIKQFCSAQELFQILSQAGTRVSLATIYRNLQTLSETGHLETVLSEDGQTLYRYCATPSHHHHLVCRNCGKSTDIAGHEIEKSLTIAAKKSGYTDLSHRIEIFGTCQDCA